MRMFIDPVAVYLHRAPVDFRVGINGLAARVEAEMALSPLSGALFLFGNKHRDKVKILYWDETGFALWQKRLEEARFVWPKRLTEAVVSLTADQLQWLLAGYDITALTPHKSLYYARVS
jgi:transposase